MTSTTSAGETLSLVSTQPSVAVTVTVTCGGGGGGGGGGEDTPDSPGWDEEEDWLTGADEDGRVGVTGVVGDVGGVIRVGDG